MVDDTVALIAQARRYGQLDLIDGMIIIRGQFPRPLIEALRERKEEVRSVLSTLPRPAKGEALDLPDGWQDAVDLWVRLGCPPGDPIITGLSFLALKRLAALPEEQRAAHLRTWRRQVRERRTTRNERDRPRSKGR